MVNLVVGDGANEGNPPALHPWPHDIRGISCMPPQLIPTSAWTCPQPSACIPSMVPLRRLRKGSKAAWKSARWPTSSCVEDLNRVPVEHLPDIGMAMTVVGGEIVYEASPSQQDFSDEAADSSILPVG
jgi:hypothetical protein